MARTVLQTYQGSVDRSCSSVWYLPRFPSLSIYQVISLKTKLTSMAPKESVQKAKEQREKEKNFRKLRRSRATQELALAQSRGLNITVAGATRTFTQVGVSGAGFRCLWRAIATGYYGNAEHDTTLLDRALALYLAATSDEDDYRGSPLQHARRALYGEMKRMSDDPSSGFEASLIKGTWGKYTANRSWFRIPADL